MASLYNRTGYFGITFRFSGKKYNRSLKTTDPAEAESIRKLVEATLFKLEKGDLAIPTDADFVTFVVSGGKVSALPLAPQGLTLKQLVDDYKAAVEGSVEGSTYYTIGIHTKHVLRFLGNRFNPRTLGQEHVQQYIATRQKEKTNRGGTVTSTTIRKEITTLSGIWSWAPETYNLNRFPNKRKLRYAKAAEKSPFQTLSDIERQIKRGGLTKDEESRLWDCLFLSLKETAELLEYVEGRRRATLPLSDGGNGRAYGGTGVRSSVRSHLGTTLGVGRDRSANENAPRVGTRPGGYRCPAF